MMAEKKMFPIYFYLFFFLFFIFFFFFFFFFFVVVVVRPSQPTRVMSSAGSYPTYTVPGKA